MTKSIIKEQTGLSGNNKQMEIVKAQNLGGKQLINKTRGNSTQKQGRESYGIDKNFELEGIHRQIDVKIKITPERRKKR